MGASKYVGVPSGTHQDAPEVAVAAAIDNGDSPPLATATKVYSQPVDGPGDDIITVTWEKGEVQPSAYRDKWFAIAFIAHLLVVLGAGMAFGPAPWANDVAKVEEMSVYVDDDVDVESEGSPQNAQEAPPKEYWFAVVAIALMSAPALSFVALTIMSR
jgi:hypothetical protein